jgi:HK97 family phage prohead protease
MTMEQAVFEAARERAQNVRARADRPSQRRSAEARGARAAMLAHADITLTRAKKAEVPAEEASVGALHFNGVATAYESGYEMWDAWGPYIEIVSAGAGEKSMKRTDLDVPLVLGHDQLRRIARTLNGTLTLEESDAGLIVDAPSLDALDADVAYIAPKLTAGLIDEMSFAFRIVRGEWSPDYSQYRISEYDIHRGDVAIVGYGANPATSAGMRAARNDGDARARALLALAIAR